jgi:CheY-like chemotaxis protein
MSLVGSLEDLGLGDILQIVSLARKSGMLSLRWGEVRGKLIFKDGLVVAALSSETHDDLADRLAGKGLITREQAQESERLLEHGGAGKTLKDVLVSRMNIPPDGIEDVVKDQVETVVFSFFNWPEGNFNFDLIEVESEIRDLKKPWRDFVLEVGLSPQYLAMEGTRRHDESKRAEREAPVGPVSEPSMGENPPAAQDDGPPGEDDFSSVSDFVKAVEEKEKAEKEAPPPQVAQVEQAQEIERVEVEEAKREKDAKEEAAAPPRPEPVSTGPCIMIVDDDPFLLQSIEHHLVSKGYRAYTFSSALEAEKKWRDLREAAEQFVILADLIMPSSEGDNLLGGLEFLKKVRAEDPSCVFWLMTDYENELAEKQARETGVNYYFYKPKSSQLDEDFSSPELLNFVAVLENALGSMPAPAAFEKKPEGPLGPAAERDSLYNLAEELSKELGDEELGFTASFLDEPPSRGISMLKAMINELNDPSSSGQITLLVLRFAAEMMNRAVIFLVARNQLAGLGQFGIDLDGKDPEVQVRRIRIPLNEPSIFQETLRKRMALKKQLKHNKWNDYLIERLGGEEPAEVFVAPIISSGRIAAILYGDNIPENREIGDTESLEIFLAQAGLAMEKALLERRLSELKAER